MGEVRIGGHKTSMREIVGEADQSDQSTPDAGQDTDTHGDRTSEICADARRIAICVGKERNTGLGALKWAIETNFIPAEGYIRLLHVMRPLRFIRNRMGIKQPVDRVNSQTLRRFKDKRFARTMKLFDDYIELCKRNKIMYELCYSENESVRRELVIQISKLMITDILVEKSSQSFLQRIVGSKSISSYLGKNTPGSCNLVIIRNGTLYGARGCSFSPTENVQNRHSFSGNLSLSPTASICTTVMTGLSQELELAGYIKIYSPSQRSFNERTTPKAFFSPPSSRLAHDDYAYLDVEAGDPHADLNTEQTSPETYPPTPWAFISRHSSREIENANFYTEPSSRETEALVSRDSSHEIGNADLDSESNSPETEPPIREALLPRHSSHEIRQAHTDSKSNFLRNHQVAEGQWQRDAALSRDNSSSFNASFYQSKLEELIAMEKILHEKLEEEVSMHTATKKELERERTLRRIAEERALGQSKAAFSGRRGDHNFWWQYSFEEIESATENFNEMSKLGQGTYGQVYKGKLHHSSVAIKVLAEEGIGDRDEFQKNLELLSRLHHPHLVMLIGACPDKTCLIYEYMANGSLEERLYCQGGTPPLPWFTRFRICHEVASALLFLHSRPQPIIHRDLKLRNVLLDHGFVSKITDIRVSDFVPINNAANAAIVRDIMFTETLAFMDPHHLRTGIVSCEADVYSLGILILQLLTGRPPVGIAYVVEEALESEQFYEMLDQSAGEWPLAEAKAVASLGLRCMEPRPKDRPKLEAGVLPVLESVQKPS